MALQKWWQSPLRTLHTLFICSALGLLMPSTFVYAAEKDKNESKIYKLTIKSDSNWTKVEIRDDAVWTIPEDESMTQIESKKGIKVYTISSKSIYLKPQSRGELTVDIFVKSPNNILGLNICKGSSSSYTLVQSSQGKQKNDVNERDHCEKAALVLNLH